jgi:hypothetical protein
LYYYALEAAPNSFRRNPFHIAAKGSKALRGGSTTACTSLNLERERSFRPEEIGLNPLDKGQALAGPVTDRFLRIQKSSPALQPSLLKSRLKRLPILEAPGALAMDLRL